MSNNLTLTIDGKDISVPQTTTAETNYILGVDTSKQVEADGFTHNGFSISYSQKEFSFLGEEEVDDFQECLMRFKDFVLKKSIQYNDIENDGVEAFFLIKSRIQNIQYEKDSVMVKQPEISFSFC